jgi:hypothetical protein
MKLIHTLALVTVFGIASASTLAGGTRCFNFANYTPSGSTPTVTPIASNDLDVWEEADSIRLDIVVTCPDPNFATSTFWASVMTPVHINGAPIVSILQANNMRRITGTDQWRGTFTFDIPPSTPAFFLATPVYTLSTGNVPYTVDHCLSAIQIDFSPSTVSCPGDLAGPNTPICSSGTPNGRTNLVDLRYFEYNFKYGNIRADLDNGSRQGITDGIVDDNDLVYFLNLLAGGC